MTDLTYISRIFQLPKQRFRLGSLLRAIRGRGGGKVAGGQGGSYGKERESHAVSLPILSLSTARNGTCEPLKGREVMMVNKRMDGQ